MTGGPQSSIDNLQSSPVSYLRRLFLLVRPKLSGSSSTKGILILAVSPRRGGGRREGWREAWGRGEDGAAARPMRSSEGHSTGISRPISFWIASSEKT